MPIRLRYDESLEWKIAFSYSPTLEMMMSLHVLCDAKHHALHLQWAVQVKRRMDRRMLADQRYFGRGFREYLILCDLILPQPGSDLKGFEEEMEELEGLTDLEFAYRMLREGCTRQEVEQALAGGEDRERFLKRFQEDPPSSLGNAGSASTSFCPATAQRQAVKDLLGDPRAFRARLSGFLRRYWDEVFAAEFERLEPRFLSDVAEKAYLLRTAGPLALLAQLSDRIAAHEEEGEVVIYKQMDAEIDGRKLQSVTITPTYFGAPHLIVGIDPDHFQLWYDIVATAWRRQPTIPPARLVALLRALGDEVRLTILKLVAEKRRSTQELAQIIGITPPSVSRHLRILKEAGLLAAEGEGYYVFYSLVPAEMVALGRNLTDFVDLRPADPGAAPPLSLPGLAR